MTSREFTSLLPRADALLGESTTLADFAAVLAFGAIQWPWLLKSLWGGRKRDKAALLARLGLPGDALPNLGSWKADTGLLDLIVDTVFAVQPKQVVELGSGASTLVIAQALKLAGGGQLTSYDQHGDFVRATRQWLSDHDLSADMRAAPLGPPPEGWRGLWYQLTGVPAAIDLLIIDGPHWTLHPLVRGAAETLFERIAPGGTVILDDAARPGERGVARRWKQDWPNFEWRFRPGIKGTLIGTRR